MDSPNAAPLRVSELRLGLTLKLYTVAREETPTETSAASTAVPSREGNGFFIGSECGLDLFLIRNRDVTTTSVHCALDYIQPWTRCQTVSFNFFWRPFNN